MGIVTVALMLLVVFLVWQFGLVVGIVAALVVGWALERTLRAVRQKHFNPHARYDAEQRALRKDYPF